MSQENFLEKQIEFLTEKRKEFNVISNDELEKCEVLDFSLLPQTLMYLKMHQCYSEAWVGYQKQIDIALRHGETKCGEICVKRLLEGEKGHYGILESPSITFACGYIDHDTVMQARTHRIGVSFAVQSMRYTSEHFIKAANGLIPVEDVFYLEQPGIKFDRQGNKFDYTHEQYEKKIDNIHQCLNHYASLVSIGMPPEKARDVLPHNYRQHFVVTFNLRSFLHFADLRLKKDAQDNIVKLADKLYGYVEKWVPEICGYYTEKRKGKARLAP